MRNFQRFSLGNDLLPTLSPSHLPKLPSTFETYFISSLLQCSLHWSPWVNEQSLISLSEFPQHNVYSSEVLPWRKSHVKELSENSTLWEGCTARVCGRGANLTKYCISWPLIVWHGHMTHPGQWAVSRSDMFSTHSRPPSYSQHRGLGLKWKSTRWRWPGPCSHNGALSWRASLPAV